MDIKELEKRGVSSGENKVRFTAKKKEPLIQKCIDTLASRIKDVHTANLETYRTYWAIDLAHEAPFAQTTATMVQNLLSRNLSEKEVEAQMKSFGLSEADLFISVDVKNEAGAVIGTKNVLNYPVFYKVVFPIVIAYHTARLSVMYGERDTAPLFPFKPLKQTDRNRVLCDIWTDIVDSISTWYGYPVYLKQGISQMLKYGVMLAFPQEEWHVEWQIKDGVRHVEKEGIRYVMPHPTCMGWDLHHPLPTINTDTGCEWACHRNVLSYGSILDNRMYWNRKAITHSSTNWLSPTVSQNYYQEAYPCTLKFPAVVNNTKTREDKAALYSSANRDNAVFLTTMFWKLIPKDWGLGDYKYPVWHRFDLANDDTVIWAAPCAYNPVWFMGYDFDSQAGQHSSLSLEAIPWQDQLGNFLSQMHLTAKQNLLNVIYYDKNLVDINQINEMKNLGEGKYRSFNFIPYDSMQHNRTGAPNPSQAFFQMQFTPRSIVEQQSMISTHLNMMERVLGFTAQETGGAAQHYQSAKEVGITSGASNTRRNFTASGVDDGTDAWKLQIVTGAKAYLNNSIEAQVSSDIRDYEKHVIDLGFEIKGEGERKVLVRGKKAGLPLETFARSNIGPQQPNDPATAQVIMQSLGVAMQNENVFKAIGATKIVRLLEQAAKLAGAPKDFNLNDAGNDGGKDDELLAKIAPVLQQLQQSILEAVQAKFIQPIAQQNAGEEQAIKQIQEVIQELQKTYVASGVEGEKLKLAQAELQQKLQLQQVESASRLQIQQQEFTADEQRKADEHSVNMRIAQDKSASEIRIREQAAQVAVATDLAKTQATVDATGLKAKASAAAAGKKS